jgi:AAA15 family ATPase/GTPase
MVITGLKLKNWRNFREAEIRLTLQSYVIGPNAVGKSNLLDAFRFLRDILSPVRGWVTESGE